MSRALQRAATLMARRLQLLKKMAHQARERGETHLELHVDEVFESGDEQALAAYESALNEINGHQPLPMEIIQ